MRSLLFIEMFFLNSNMKETCKDSVNFTSHSSSDECVPKLYFLEAVIAGVTRAPILGPSSVSE